MEAQQSARKMSHVQNETHPGTRRKLIMVTSQSPPLPQRHPQCQYLQNMPTLRSSLMFLHSCMILLQLLLNIMLVIIFSSISPLHLLLLLLLAT